MYDFIALQSLGEFTFYTSKGTYTIYCELLQAKYLANHATMFNGDPILNGIWETSTNKIYL